MSSGLKSGVLKSGGQNNKQIRYLYTTTPRKLLLVLYTKSIHIRLKVV